MRALSAITLRLHASRDAHTALSKLKMSQTQVGLIDRLRTLPERRIAATVVLLVVTIAAYLPTLSSYFIADDFAMLVRPTRSLRDFVVTHQSYMRPVGHLSRSIEHSIWGVSPTMSHVVNLTLHLACALLVGVLARRTSGRRDIGFLASLLFALHPIHPPAVSWITARFDLFCTVFVLGSLVLYDKHRESSSRSPLTFSVVLYIPALFSKELALVLPVLLIWLDLVRRGRTRLWSLAPFAVTTLVYIALRIQLLGGMGGRIGPGATPLRFQMTVLEFLAGLIGHPGRALIVPVNELYWGGATPILAAVLWVLLALVVVVGVRRATSRCNRTIALGMGMLLIASLPTADRLGEGFAAGFLNARYLYLPSVGFCLLVSGLMGRVADSAHGKTLALGLATIYAVLTYGNNIPWREAGTLSARVPRQVTEMFPDFGVKRPILIVQDVPARHRGAYVYPGNSLRPSLTHARVKVQRLILIPPGMGSAPLRKVPDLRTLGNSNSVFALRWDPKLERLIDETTAVRARMRDLSSKNHSTLVWEGPTLSEWSVPSPISPVTSEGMVLSGPGAKIQSPPLPLSTRTIELDLLATPLSPSEPAVIQGRLIWNATGDGRNTQRRFFVKVDGTRQTISVPLELRRLEQLQAPSLQCRIQFLAAKAGVEVHAIRAVP